MRSEEECTPKALSLNRTIRPYVLLAMMQAADVATTAYVLSTWTHSKEKNPVVDALFSLGGIGPGLVLLLGLKLLVVWLLYQKQTRVRFVAALYAAVITNNTLALFGIFLLR